MTTAQSKAKRALLPCDYIEQESARLEMRNFSRAFYLRLPRDAPRLPDAQLARLHEMMCDYRRLFWGISSIRKNRVVIDLRALEKIVRTASKTLKAMIPKLQRLEARGGPHTARAEFIVRELVRINKWIDRKFPEERLHELHGQASWAAKLLQDPLEQEFLHSFEKLLRRYIRPFQLSDKEAREYLNRVIAGVMILNDQTRRSYVERTVLDRAKNLRYKARKAALKGTGTGNEEFC